MPWFLPELGLDDDGLALVLLVEEALERPDLEREFEVLDVEPVDRDCELAEERELAAPFDRDVAPFFAELLLDDELFFAEELRDEEAFDEEPPDEELLAFLDGEANFDPADERDFEAALDGPFFAELDLDELDLVADELDFEPAEDLGRFELDPELDVLPYDFLVTTISFPPFIRSIETYCAITIPLEDYGFGRVDDEFSFRFSARKTNRSQTNV